MKRWIVGLGAIFTLAGPISCLEDVGPESFTTEGTCLVGETRPCECSRNRRGVERCTADGTFSDDCSCEGCTVLPDCNECDEEDDCFNACMCHFEGIADPVACELRCSDDGQDGAGGTTSGGGGTSSSGGLTSSASGGSTNQGSGGAGQRQCADVTVLGIVFDGCCQPNGQCGVIDSVFMQGCVASILGGTMPPQPCQVAR